MTPEDALQLLFVAAAAVLAPIIGEPLRRFAIPAVVFEIGFGYVLGPQVLGWVQPTGLVAGLSTLGLSMLMSVYRMLVHLKARQLREVGDEATIVETYQRVAREQRPPPTPR